MWIFQNFSSPPPCGRPGSDASGRTVVPGKTESVRLPAQLIYAIEEVLNGKIYLPNALTSRFFEYFQQSFKNENAKPEIEEENLLSELTQREEEVLELLTQGITYKGVANKLFISETTVKTHVNNIFQKLQVNDRTQAVLYAINNGFLSKKVKISA